MDEDRVELTLLLVVVVSYQTLVLEENRLVCALDLVVRFDSRLVLVLEHFLVDEGLQAKLLS